MADPISLTGAMKMKFSIGRSLARARAVLHHKQSTLTPSVSSEIEVTKLSHSSDFPTNWAMAEMRIAFLSEGLKWNRHRKTD
ncbi:unnamed protein product [Citrullus colocynthis]|uniref:Uncharacterized protein n=1 Tax=Citrullus colocynthis TaxID=252529 RepID=A0ABP0YEV9_9ROSI